MKKFLVIGNPIEHSLSPPLHNYWIKKNNIEAIYEKQKIEEKDLKDLVVKVKERKINGVNITVPFKNKIIPHLDKLSKEAQETQSVNTIYLNENKVVGHNTDVEGFELSIKEVQFNIANKKILILGAGGVVPSIIYALNKIKVHKIILSNRTKKKAENLLHLSNKVEVTDWGIIPDFDMIINATSVGLNDKDALDLDLSKVGKDKLFYDVIYNPKETIFLKNAKKSGNKIENGKRMFIHQAAISFKIWHNIEPEINEEVIKLLDK